MPFTISSFPMIMLATDDIPLLQAARDSSAFDKVLTETIVEIFYCCLPTYHLHCRQPNTKIAPMLLCQVSSRWRSIVMSNPSLWIYLNYVARRVTLEGISDAETDWPIERAF